MSNYISQIFNILSDEPYRYLDIWNSSPCVLFTQITLDDLDYETLQKNKKILEKIKLELLFKTDVTGTCLIARLKTMKSLSYSCDLNCMLCGKNSDALCNFESRFSLFRKTLSRTIDPCIITDLKNIKKAKINILIANLHPVLIEALRTNPIWYILYKIEVMEKHLILKKNTSLLKVYLPTDIINKIANKI